MTPINVIHAALLHTTNHKGKVVMWGGNDYSSDTVLWDPEDPNEATAYRLLNGAASGIGTNQLTCAGMAFLSDGKLLAVGGDAPTRATAWKFNPDSELWEPAGAMANPRWYPTCVKLGDDSGRVLVVGGSTSNGGPAVPEIEVYNESAGPPSFTRVWGPAGVGDTSSNRALPKLYAGLHLTPNGEIFHTRVGDRDVGSDRTAVFSFTALDRGQWTDVTQAASDPNRTEGMAVLLLKQSPTDPDRVLVVGGGGSTTARSIAVVDVPASASSMWLSGNFPDSLERTNVNAVALPDGSVFILGGIPTGGTPPNGGACMLYRPPSGPGLGTLSTMDTLQYARQHHSVALLLPSAKVMVTGGSSQTIEVFSPPYLFDAVGAPLPESARPDITSFPNPAVGMIVLHGSTFQVGTSNAASIDRVVLVKPMAATHQTDTEQRVIRLAHTVTGPSTISVTAPDGRVYPYGVGGGHTHAIAGRGYYMLFLINTAGVPSRAKFIRLV
jgi:hypothetical protein